MKWIKYAIVHGLVGLCTVLDNIPRYEQGRWWRYGDWGCYPFRLAYQSATLDSRWHTGAWEPASNEHRSLYDDLPLKDPGQPPEPEAGQG